MFRGCRKRNKESRYIKATAEAVAFIYPSVLRNNFVNEITNNFGKVIIVLLIVSSHSEWDFISCY